MTVSATWSKTPAALGLALLLGGCQGLSLPFPFPGVGSSPQVQVPPVRRGERPVAAKVPPPDTAGLTPLPPAQEVVAAVPSGRVDPFSSPLLSGSGKLPAGVAGNPGAPGGPPVRPPLSLPEAFRFNGVVASYGRPQALVQFGAVSGSLGPGDQGGRTTDLLPVGWSVQAVDVQRGLLVLRQADRTITAEL
ncbi:MAG: hypothetical protein ACKO5F_11780 [Synechococcus sp.]